LLREPRHCGYSFSAFRGPFSACLVWRDAAWLSPGMPISCVHGCTILLAAGCVTGSAFGFLTSPRATWSSAGGASVHGILEDDNENIGSRMTCAIHDSSVPYEVRHGTRPGWRRWRGWRASALPLAERNRGIHTNPCCCPTLRIW
jgi:hypothetical protein